MRVIEAHIGHAYLLTQSYCEYLRDTGKDDSSYKKNFEAWLYRFNDPTFRCLIALHGRKTVGIAFGNLLPHEPEKTFRMEVFFVRRAFRKFRFVKAMVLAGREFLAQNEVRKLMLCLPKPKKKGTVEGVIVGVSLG